MAGAAAVIVSLSTGSAGAAVPRVVDCRTPDGGAGGSLNWEYASRTRIDPVVLGAHDKAADRAWVRVRLDIVTGSGRRVTYPWHANHEGSGSSKQWVTHASNSSGIVSARVEVQNVKGSSPVATCYSKKAYNPYY
ncbi:hypothetical protein OOK36_47835 [Streptomyces sp. NBC_00365]|uniref:hypothetical protein n=1 Tax=Streptomyces sp. NBC_00365 TaxID=2975726 RepID=UPI002256A9DC|nr:hypothetical protein [Streptomyces sp. NBC_00365]MCX5096338.1 hypothetical protein [Streptomyces sp. NBC_00365]